MSRYDDAARLLKEGRSPHAIAMMWNTTVSQIVPVLYTAVGRRLISRSDILFTIDEQTAMGVESAVEHLNIRNRWELSDVLRSASQGALRPDDDVLQEALLYFDLREASLADMYELLCRLERFLHRYIRLTLTDVSGSPETFWRKLPLNVREDCVRMKEQDEEPQDDSYSYTTLIHLKMIFDKHWPTLSRKLPEAVRADKKMFLETLQGLNSIRNRVMHPVRGYRPSSAEFEYVREFALAMLGNVDPG